ncbi:hypothetical protein DPMN_173309 [Dreissena polymorpha]|uniref:Secreted protein n=1 Tax=Dreissena polymorpha TaxID=45954 RepID=A0A9D4IHG3_DREPO|nr:hypothetical protein DPMN_173309 [Dreissena polymorpha]
MQVTYQCCVCAVLGALLLPEVHLMSEGAIFQISSPAATAMEPRVTTESPPLCEFSIWGKSKIFFVSRLRQMNPKFIKFGIQFYNGTNVIEHIEPEVLQRNPNLVWDVFHGGRKISVSELEWQL